MNHQYSKFKNKAIPYAKVGRRVFGSLFNAETFCSDHGLDVNSAIEYGEIPELKNEVQEIAKYQKAVLREVLHRLEKRCSFLHGEIKTDEPRTLDFSWVRGFLVTNVCIVQRSAA